VSESDNNQVVLSDEIKELAAACFPRHVEVVQAILSGKYSSNTKAYMSLYPDSSVDAARSSVADLLANPNTKRLYTALREEKLMEGVLTRSEAMKILTDMATTSMGDIIEFGNTEIGIDPETGDPVMAGTWKFKNSKDMTEEQLRSINEVASTAQGLKIKQHDQKAAIKQLAEMAGWEAPKKIKHSGELTSTTPDMDLETATRIYEDNLKRSDG